jgi:MFS family permease
VNDTGDSRAAWTMLLVLIGGFALSQAFRTAAAIMAPALTQAFDLTKQQLGLFAAAFHFSFAGLQLFMGMGIDVYGPRRTILTVFPLAIAGAFVAAGAQNYATLIIGQVLIGIGCAPAFLVCTVFVSRRFPIERFAAVNGAALGIGSVGLLLTGTPLAWVIEQFSWRWGFVALAVMSALTGNVAIAISITGMIAAPLFGRLDPGEGRRRSWIMKFAIANAACFAVMAFSPHASVEVVLALVVGLMSGFGSLQYADVRSAYPPHMTGRAMAVFTMALFLGVALMQWLTGGVASAAGALHVEPYAAVLGAIALSLALGCAAFRILPAPRGLNS